tara:strand:+ start:117 stop:602 length:486 start_codon:yes stop_codon:yes gene_type:complete
MTLQPTTQFTSQSAWGSLGASGVPATITITSAGVYVNLTLSFVTDAGEMYNMEGYGTGLKIVTGLIGVFLANVSISTSGAANDTLSVRFSYREDGIDYQTLGAEYDSKGGNEWAVNQSAIIKTTESSVGLGNGVFSVELANLDSDADIVLESFMFSVIKIY